MHEIAMLFARAAFFCVLVANFVSAVETQNILFILTDDQRDNSFAAMGHDWVQTPRIDALLSQSTRFQNTYVAAPICNPSRAAMMLGTYERVNRLGFSSKHEMTPKQWEDSYPALLHQQGYFTGYVGKWHIDTPDRGDFKGLFDFCEGHFGQGKFFYEVEDAAGTTQTVTTNRLHTNNVFKFLDARPQDQPFCLSVCYATPHGSKVRKMHRKLDEPASLNPKLKDHPIYGGLYQQLDFPFPLQSPQNPYDHIPRSVMNQDLGRNKTYHFDYNKPMSREHHVRYYQMITELDQMVGEIMAGLKSRNLHQNTLVIFGSDHGLLMGEYGMGGKGLLFDLTAKIPCFVYDPNAAEETRGQVRDELVSSLDLTATILDYAHTAKPPFAEGQSLRPLVASAAKVDSWRSGLFLESMYTGRDTPIQEGYVEWPYKYIRFFKASHPYLESEVVGGDRKVVLEKLFDLSRDPQEMQDLVDRPETAEVLADLRAKCVLEVERLEKARNDYRIEYLSDL